MLNYSKQRRSSSLHLHRESHPCASGPAAVHPLQNTPRAQTNTRSGDICVTLPNSLHRSVKIGRVASLSTLTSGLCVPPPATAAAASEAGARGTITAAALVHSVRATSRQRGCRTTSMFDLLLESGIDKMC